MIELLKKHSIIPIYYHDDIESCKKALKSCDSGGVRFFEFVNRGPKAVENFELLKKVRDKDTPELKLGVGTIKSIEEAETFIELGADFLVSPIFNEGIAKAAAESNIFWIPGCMTPTEINQANDYGIELVKVFPGGVLGPKFIKAVRPIFPSISFMPTGGVDLTQENLKGWFDAGSIAVGVGSSLFPDSQNFDDVEKELRNAFNIIETLDSL